MKFSDDFFPNDGMEHVNNMVGAELRRQEMAARVLAFYDAFARDPHRQELTVAPHGNLKRLAQHETFTTLTHGNDRQSYPALHRAKSVYYSGAYNHHPHPSLPELSLASVILQASMAGHPDNTPSYHIVAMLARASGMDEQTPPSAAEVNNSVPLLVVPETNDASFDVFASTGRPGFFDRVEPAVAENVLATEIQRYVDVVNSWTNPS